MLVRRHSHFHDPGRVRLEAGRRVLTESDWPTRKALRLFALLPHRRGAAHARWRSTLSLPLYPSLSDPEAERVVACLRTVLHQSLTSVR